MNHTVKQFSTSLKASVLFLMLLLAMVQISHGQIAGEAGTFSRIGFGARGLGMGNALTAVISREAESYYNPAVPAFLESRTFSATYSFLSLDRRLNFLRYSQAVPPTAGFSVGIINAGVREIDGRDSDGEHKEFYSTAEYQFFFAFSNRFADPLSIGVAVKLYYNDLFRDATTTGVGIDFGAVYKVNESLSIGATIKDLNAKYRWDTSTLYGRQGNVTTESFPVLRTLGAAYHLPEGMGILSLDVENSNRGTRIVRVGTEIWATDYLTIRAGLDRIETKSRRDGAKPSGGFTLRKPEDGFLPSLSYAYVYEPISGSGMNLVSLSFSF